MFPNWNNIFHQEDDDDRKNLNDFARSSESSIQGNFWDEDDYDFDGNLKTAIDARKDQDYTRRTVWSDASTYGQTSHSVSGSLSKSYKKWWNNAVDWVTGASDQDKKQKFFKRELTAVARAVNSVRNFGAEGKKEQSIEVVWADQGQRNNTMRNNEIYLSPNMVDESHTLQPTWTEDQRRDALIGEALTLLGMKRISDPKIIREIQDQTTRDRSQLSRLSELRGMEHLQAEYQEEASKVKNPDLLRILSCALWRAVEQDAARAGILKEYRGSRGYFAAVQAYYSAKSVFDDITVKIKKFFKPDLSDEEKRGISVHATRALMWNLSQSLNPASQVQFPYCDVGLVLDEAQDLIQQAIKATSTIDRYNLCYDAAHKISELEPPNNSEQPQDGDPEKEFGDLGVPTEILEQLDDGPEVDVPPPNGPVPNGPGISGRQDVDDVEDENIEGLTDASENCKIVDVPKDSSGLRLREIRAENQHLLASLKRKLEPCAERNVMEEHGLRSGRLSHNALWKVGTDLPDNDRVFHRTLQVGFSKEMTLVLLVDFSGSMSGTEISTAKRIGVLVSDALDLFPEVRFEIWGHEGHGGYNNIYRFNDLAGFVNQSTGGGTDEGGAYACVAKELLKTSKPADRKVLMALGDGATDRDKVLNSVTHAKRAGVETLDLLIGSEYHRSDAEYAYGKGNVILVGNDDKPLSDQILAIVQPWLVRTISKLQKQVI